MSYDSVKNKNKQTTKYVSVSFLVFNVVQTEGHMTIFSVPSHCLPKYRKKNSQVSSFSFKELEESIRTKEKELESIEQSGLSLIQNKKEEACSAVLNTLQEINHSWANLDHMVK